MEKEHDKIQMIIDKSGNTFHANVANFLRILNWTVLISPYYNDNQTNKARETDIIAETYFDMMDRNDQRGTLNIQLFIECKKIQNEIVFWFDDKDLRQAEDMIAKTTVFPKIGVNELLKTHHHYENRKVAKLFASSKDSGKLHENEEFYKALNQTLNGMVYHRRRKHTILTENRRESHFHHKAHYPIILCDNFDKFYKINLGEDNYERISNVYFELEVNYSFLVDNREYEEYFLIDVVNFERFSDYLKELNEKDIKGMKTQIQYS